MQKRLTILAAVALVFVATGCATKAKVREFWQTSPDAGYTYHCATKSYKVNLERLDDGRIKFQLWRTYRGLLSSRTIKLVVRLKAETPLNQRFQVSKYLDSFDFPGKYWDVLTGTMQIEEINSREKLLVDFDLALSDPDSLSKKQGSSGNRMKGDFIIKNSLSAGSPDAKKALKK